MRAFNPSAIVRTGDAPIILGIGQPHHLAVSLHVKADAGRVTIEQYDFGLEDWILPADPENTISGNQNVYIERANRPPLRITAIGGAMFTFFGDMR